MLRWTVREIQAQTSGSFIRLEIVGFDTESSWAI